MMTGTTDCSAGAGCQPRRSSSQARPTRYVLRKRLQLAAAPCRPHIPLLKAVDYIENLSENRRRPRDDLSLRIRK